MTAPAAAPDPEEPREKNPHGFSAEQQGSNVPLGWKPTPSQPVPVVRCIQIKKDGMRCRRWSLRGYTKCVKHAGPGVMKDGNVAKYAESVIEGARLRLIDDADKALDVLQELIGPGTSEGIRLKAATEVLDRAGVRGGFDVKVDVQVSENPSDLIKERLAGLAEGAAAVQRMKDKRAAELEEERQRAEADGDIIDAEVVSDNPDPDPDDPDEQGVLF